MTGEKNRSVSVEKLWKIDDKELTTPLHDELVISTTPSFVLSRLPNLVKELRSQEIFNWCWDKEPVSEQTLKERSYQGLNHYVESTGSYLRIKNKPEPPSPTPLYSLASERERKHSEEYDKKAKQRYEFELEGWLREKPIFEENVIKQDILSKKHIADYKQYCEYLQNTPYTQLSSTFGYQHEVPIVSGLNKYIIGYWDIVMTINNPLIFVSPDGRKYPIPSTPWNSPSLYIEIKPTIRSYGETIRQLNTYREYLPSLQRGQVGGYIILVTPDIRFKEAFESQGIIVISP